MSWTRTIATGSGSIAWRLSVEGWPYEAVTHSGMEQTLADGRQRKVGLKSDGFRLSEKVDLVRAKWEPQGFTVSIADVGRVWTTAFAKRPQAVTYHDPVGGSLNASGTTVTVHSTASFGSTGTIHIDGEAITYSGKTGTAFTGCTRGAWDTFAQYHYTADGERLRHVEVTDLPQIAEGRRAKLYAYGAGNDKSGNGELVWTGVVRTEPSFNGVEWSFRVDPLSSLLDVDLGSDLKDPAPLRGIYYTDNTPFALIIEELDSAGWGGSPNAAAFVAMAGFWETQEAFCESLTTHIGTAIASTTYGTFTQTSVRAVPFGESWAIEFLTHSTTPVAMRFHGPGGDGPVSSVDGKISPAYVDVASGSTGSSVSSTGGKIYRLPLEGAPGLESPGSVPRMALSEYPDAIKGAVRSWSAGAEIVDLDGTYPFDRFYLGGGADLDSSVTQSIVEWESNGSATSEWEFNPVDVDSVNASSRYIQCDGTGGFGASVHVATAANVPTFRLGRDYGTGNLGTCLQSIVDDAAEYRNTGAVPDLRPGDFTNSGADIGADTDINHAASSVPLGQGRRYTVFAEVGLAELIEHESRLIGVYPCYDSSGLITFRRIRLPSASEVGGNAMSAANILVSNGFLSWDPSALGLFNTVVLRTGYDPIEDEFRGVPYKIRDVAAHGVSPQSRSVEIAPKSIDPDIPITYERALEAGARIVGVFGSRYAFLTVEVPLSLFSVLLGDVVTVTWSKVPESDGTLGVDEKVGIVVGRDWDLRDGRGEFTILMTDQRIGGYAPASTLSGITGTSGGTGNFSANWNATYMPSGTQAADFLEAGDKIRIYHRDSTSTSGNVTGEVVSVTANSVTFTTDSAWSHAAASNWTMGLRVSTAITAAGQKRFVYIANSDLTLDYSSDTDNPPFTLAP